MFEEPIEKQTEEALQKRLGTYGYTSYQDCHKLYTDGFKDGYQKANKWHYVKDGDLPTDKPEKIYLVALKSEYGGFFYETDIWCESLHCFASNNPTKIYAWKEIVLPELKEIE